MTEDYRSIEEALGYTFKDISLLETALTHRSFRYEQDQVEKDNQRLEFLGDAVLGLASAAHLFKEHPTHREGNLTRLRSSLTNSKVLARVGSSLELGKYLRLGKGEEQSGGATRPSNIADAVESILGAIYLDSGMAEVTRVFDRLFLTRLADSVNETWTDNPKGALQEYCQCHWKCSPRYRIVKEHGPAHSRSFTSEVLIHERVMGTGCGASKRDAESAAARNALQSLAQ
ncbi:MAG: ribonuclease III [Verrucomicrobia bacterium]|nr:ribonuclease III [Verrucomicrobiota bacterium]